MKTNALFCVGSPDLGLESILVIGMAPGDFDARRLAFSPRSSGENGETRFPANPAWCDFLGQLASEGVAIDVIGTCEIDPLGRTPHGKTIARSEIHVHVGTCDGVLPTAPPQACASSVRYEDVNAALLA